MKILVICQYYYPEPVRIVDICEELAKRGNKVTVLTGIPNYPMGDYYKGYSIKKNRIEEINGVKVHRCFTIPRKKNSLMRLFNYHSFSFFSSMYIKKLKEEYDVIFVNQLSPIMMANSAIKYKKKNNKKIVMYCLDIWPESLCVGGIKKNSLIYKFYYKISKKIYSHMDRILITSKSFKSYFIKNFGISENIIDYLPQYAESIFKPEECKKEKNDKIDLLFAGNIGKAQSIDTLISAALLLKNKKNLYFHIVGDGQEYLKTKNKIESLNLTNVIMYGRKPLNEMPKYYKMADAMLVTLCGDSFISYTLPGKVQTYMAAGKPIIASANGETKEIIEDSNCGFCTKADDAQELANSIIKFINSNEKEIFSNNSFSYYKNNFSKDVFIKKLMIELGNNLK